MRQMQREDRREYSRAYYLSNRKRIIERVRQWSKENPGKVRAYARAGAKRRRKKITEYQRTWRSRNPGILRKYAALAKEYKRKWYNENRNRLLARAAHRYRQNREIVLCANKEYRAKHKARLSAERRKRYATNREQILAKLRADRLRRNGGALKHQPPARDPAVRRARRRADSLRWQLRHNWKVLRRSRRKDSGPSATAEGRARKALLDKKSHTKHWLKRNVASRLRSHGIKAASAPSELVAAVQSHIRIRRLLKDKLR